MAGMAAESPVDMQIQDCDIQTLLPLLAESVR